MNNCILFLLLLSDIRSEGRIAIVKKFDFDFIMVSVLYHSHIIKKCFRKISVCVCLSVWPLPNIEPKQIDRSCSKSVSRVLSQISRAFFNFSPTPKIKGSSHEKKIKNFDFLKNGSNDFD